MRTALIHQTIRSMQHRAEHLEREAGQLRRDLARMAELVAEPDRVVAKYTIEGETYEITQSEADEIRQGLMKPRADSVIYELAAIKKSAQRLRERPADEHWDHLFGTIEAIRSEAVANGTAIDDGDGAAIDD